MGQSINVFIAGVPQSRGSKRAFPYKKATGKLGVRVSDNNPKSRDWMAMIADVVGRKMSGREPLNGPVELWMIFTMPRPKSHFGSGKNADRLKPTAPRFHTSKPDRGKLARAVEDALTGIAYRDDSQVVCGPIEKIYGSVPGVNIVLTPME